jgi:hypothetical protein
VEEDLREILSAGLADADPRAAVLRSVRVEGNTVLVGDERFESACRLFVFPAKPVKTERPDACVGGFVSSTSVVEIDLWLRPCRRQRAFPWRGCPVRVAVKGHGYAGVPEEVLNQLWVYAATK